MEPLPPPPPPKPLSMKTNYAYQINTLLKKFCRIQATHWVERKFILCRQHTHFNLKILRRLQFYALDIMQTLLLNLILFFCACSCCRRLSHWIFALLCAILKSGICFISCYLFLSSTFTLSFPQFYCFTWLSLFDLAVLLADLIVCCFNLTAAL